MKEYKVMKFSHSDTHGAEKEINRLALQGWTLAFVSGTEMYHYVMERALPHL